MAKKKKHPEAPATPEPEAPEAEPAQERDVKIVDKRRFARLLGFGPELEPGEGAAPSSDAVEERQFPSYVEELRARAERAEAHARAEVEATRARLERYYESQLASARADLAAGLLEVLDNLERALEAPGASESPLFEGIAATRDIFLKKLADFGLEPVATLGAPFDPEIHEAIDQVAVDDPELDGRVVERYQTGFRLGDRLVRPARVRVGRHQEAEVGSPER